MRISFQVLFEPFLEPFFEPNVDDVSGIAEFVNFPSDKADEDEIDGSVNETLTLTNTGEEEMTFDALVYYLLYRIKTHDFHIFTDTIVKHNRIV